MFTALLGCGELKTNELLHYLKFLGHRTKGNKKHSIIRIIKISFILFSIIIVTKYSMCNCVLLTRIVAAMKPKTKLILLVIDPAYGYLAVS